MSARAHRHGRRGGRGSSRATRAAYRNSSWACAGQIEEGLQPSLGGDRSRALGRLWQLAQLRLQPILEHAVDTVEIDVDDRRDVERQELRQQQPANHGDAERLT